MYIPFNTREGAKVDVGADLVSDKGNRLLADIISIGSNVTLGSGIEIRARSIEIGDNVKVGDNFNCLVSDRLSIGDNTIMLHDISFTGASIVIGSDNFVRELVEIGGGGSTNRESMVTIGDGNLICERVLINNARSVHIGSHVGIGKEVDIWTHGGFMRALEGYPTIWAPVRIGDNVWIPSRTSVLAGVTIGDDVIIGNHSLVNRDIPSGSFAAGAPVRIIKENAIPKDLTAPEKEAILNDIVNQFIDLMDYKGIQAEISVEGLKVSFNGVVFDCEAMAVSGELDDFAEDFRDHLRRNGIKFFTGRPFRSITPPAFREVMR